MTTTQTDRGKKKETAQHGAVGYCVAVKHSESVGSTNNVLGFFFSYLLAG